MLRIRRAEIADALILCEAERQIAATPGRFFSMSEELEVEAFAGKIDALSEPGTYVVAVADEQIVGHAFLGPPQPRSRSHVVTLPMSVHPGNERKGIGSALLDHLIAWAMSSAATRKIELHVIATNQGAVALYQTRHFVIEGILANRVALPSGEYADVLSMALGVADL